jgi:glycosyltransferase involved in cell wall biosynthesis
VRIRVLEILASLRRAGAEHVAVSIACRLDREKFDPAVISMFDPFPGGLEPVLEQSGIRTWHLGKRSGLDLRMYPRIAKVFREFRPHVIHTHSYVLRYALPASMGVASPERVHTVHNMADKEVETLGRWIHRIGFRLGVTPVAVATEVARSVETTYGLTGVVTIPNGIDTARFGQPEQGAEWRREQGFADEDLLITSVARLEPQKNTLGLIDAFSSALKDDPRCHLLLAGDGQLREAARDRARHLGLSGRIRLLGVTAEVPALLAASDLFVLASDWEGNPMSVMEAMAAGLPVVATAVGGVPELIEDGVTGILVPPGDGESFARALGSLVERTDSRRRMGESARVQSARFSEAVMVDSYAALFERMVRIRR